MGPTANPTEAANRDGQRQQDLATIAEALQQYRQENGSYPVAERLQSFCRYQDSDAGCQVAAVLDPLPRDPSRSDPSPDRFYHYVSDGSMFTLVAVMEGSPPSSNCPDLPEELGDREKLYCVTDATAAGS